MARKLSRPPVDMLSATIDARLRRVREVLILAIPLRQALRPDEVKSLDTALLAFGIDPLRPETHKP